MKCKDKLSSFIPDSNLYKKLSLLTHIDTSYFSKENIHKSCANISVDNKKLTNKRNQRNIKNINTYNTYLSASKIRLVNNNSSIPHVNVSYDKSLSDSASKESRPLQIKDMKLVSNKGQSGMENKSTKNVKIDANQNMIRNKIILLKKETNLLIKKYKNIYSKSIKHINSSFPVTMNTSSTINTTRNIKDFNHNSLPNKIIPSTIGNIYKLTPTLVAKEKTNKLNFKNFQKNQICVEYRSSASNKQIVDSKKSNKGNNLIQFQTDLSTQYQTYFNTEPNKNENSSLAINNTTENNTLLNSTNEQPSSQKKTIPDYNFNLRKKILNFQNISAKKKMSSPTGDYSNEKKNIKNAGSKGVRIWK